MTTPQPTTIRCTNCSTPVNIPVRTVIDAQQDPQGKALLVNGRLNQAPCPNCGQVNAVLAPLIYHDASKEMLVAFVPMEVAMQQNKNEEQMIGDLMNELSRNIPKEQFKAYMFNPKRALTMQGLMEQVMEADGISKEMLQSQRERVELLQRLMDSPDEATLTQQIQANDANINQEFFQTMAVMAQRLVSEGHEDIAQRLMLVQEMLLEHSTFGSEIAQQQSAQEVVVSEVAQAIQALGEDATRDDLRELALGYADDDEKLQALIGLIRPAFDYQFLQDFTMAISKAPAAEREKLERVRDRIVELTSMIDNQMQQSLQETVQFLQVLINSDDPDAMIEANAERIDNDFMNVLSTNLQEAQKRGDMQSFNRLRQIYDKVVAMLRAQMPASMRFINDLLSTEDEAEMNATLQAGIGEQDRDELTETIETVEEILQAQGQAELLQRLGKIRAALG